MTPMTDLAFLLLTFFILAATLERPRVIELIYPKDHSAHSKVNHAVTLLLTSKRNHVYLYEGKWDIAKPEAIHFDRDSVMKRLALTCRQAKSLGHPLTAIVKTLPNTPYSSVVNALDDLRIAEIEHYVVQDMENEEAAFVAQWTRN